MTFAGLLALIVVVAAVTLVVRGWDVRLVLLAAALIIASAAGAPWVVVSEFLATFSNEKFVVPICTAMGFAYVLKHTGCERHLILLLVNPLRYVRGLLVPGVIAVGFVVNIPLVSQTSTAVCLGAVVVPLMRAAGYSMATVGACLLLGASVGGELLNPSAPELLTVESVTKVRTTVQAGRYLPPLVFTQLAVSTGVLWAMSVWWERRSEGPAAIEPAGTPSPSPERISLLKASVPLVPLVLLFAAAPPFSAVEVPAVWVVGDAPGGARNPAYGSRLIGLAMLVGILCAAAAAPGRSRDCVKEFFAGAGYGFTNIISLIVTANCFGKAIKAAGLADTLGALIADAPHLMLPLAALVPLAFAAICGSGMASTQSLYEFFHGPAEHLGLDPVAIGALVSLGSAAGRTMSPVAAVVLMCGTLTNTNPFTLVKRVAGPLFAGIVVVIALRLIGLLNPI
ncbi:C4-dicarboxylate transporter DcuC [Gemmata sp. JC717]|uniref:C4-dicarboxylate transporter DcuC n=1 Tax=Gemmata algarum TaxID=2975278 RepID=UPI0021BA8C35|nr:C4-dicarboxylate transporter DcuC [Gemmata algarum]MDY3551586.1 C4-dicarboxylate transporter DcuC [Gemmata algarum]